MGFFSWECKGCTHSVREGHPSDWMTKAVVLERDGSRVIGFYDGYGRVGSGEFEILNVDHPEVWHHACWVAAGKPEWTGESRSASDQGLTNYDLPMPRHMQDVEGLRDWRQNYLREQRARTREVWKKMNDELRAKGEAVPDYALALEQVGDL
jgi:hypothetical protein